MVNPSDKSLIQACLAGDAKAWERLILRYERLIFSVAARSGLLEDDAADVFQNVCLRLMENLSKLTNDTHIAGWLATTTRWESLRVLRENRREYSFTELTAEDEAFHAGEIPSQDLLPHDEMMSLQREHILRLCMEELGESCRRMLTLLYLTVPKPSYSEIAREFDIVESAVGAKRARCLHSLRKILRKHNFEEHFLDK